MDRFIDNIDFELTQPEKNLKSNMDRFIEIKVSNIIKNFQI